MALHQTPQLPIPGRASSCTHLLLPVHPLLPVHHTLPVLVPLASWREDGLGEPPCAVGWWGCMNVLFSLSCRPLMVPHCLCTHRRLTSCHRWEGVTVYAGFAYSCPFCCGTASFQFQCLIQWLILLAFFTHHRSSSLCTSYTPPSLMVSTAVHWTSTTPLTPKSTV